MYFGETKEEWGRARARWWGGGVREFAGAIVQECLLYETARLLWCIRAANKHTISRLLGANLIIMLSRPITPQLLCLPGPSVQTPHLNPYCAFLSLGLERASVHMHAPITAL